MTGKKQNDLKYIEELLERLGVAGDADWMALVLFVRNLLSRMSLFTADQKAAMQAAVFEGMSRKPLGATQFHEILGRIEAGLLESPRVQNLRDTLRSEHDAFSTLYEEVGRVFSDIKAHNDQRQTHIARMGEQTEKAMLAAPDRTAAVNQLKSMLEGFVAQAREEARGWEERARQLERTANFDPMLSELYSRRAFDAQLAEAAKRCQASGKPLSLMFIDVDRFKVVNDTYGHVAGDGVLRVLAAIVSAHAVQFGGYSARYGGEELVVLCEGLDEKAAVSRAEALRLDVSRCPFVNSAQMGQGGQGGEPEILRVTVSIGVAQLHPGQNASDLVLAADRSMYAAKGRGRNTVAGVSSLAGEPSG